MARMMKFGRTTPQTTDPSTGARIADPEKYGNNLVGPSGESQVSSWPVVREAYKAGKYGARRFTGNEFKYDPRVEKYLKGETDILSEDIDEPMITKRTDPKTGENTIALNERYKPGGPTYNKVISSLKVENRPKIGEIMDISTTQYNAALSKSGVSSGGMGVATGGKYAEKVISRTTKLTPTNQFGQDALALENKKAVESSKKLKNSTDNPANRNTMESKISNIKKN
jgi:hypothetical protein